MSLSTADIESLSETLSSGKHPRVVFTEAAGQIAGKSGRVMRLEEPAEGEFVVVRFGNDELPFSRDDVRVPKRGELTKRRAARPAAPVADEPPAGPPLLDNDGDARSTARVKAKESAAMNEPVPAQAGPADGPVNDDEKPAPRKRAAKPKSKPKGPELTVTLAYQDDQWQVSAARGSKVVAKPVPVKAAAAVQMVQSLESPAVAAVVEEIIDSARHAAEDEAERLRQQLAAVEARLAELA